MLLDSVCLDIMYCIEISEAKTECECGSSDRDLGSSRTRTLLGPCGLG